MLVDQRTGNFLSDPRVRTLVIATPAQLLADNEHHAKVFEALLRLARRDGHWWCYARIFEEAPLRTPPMRGGS